MTAITQERLQELLSYCRESGKFTWKVKRGNQTTAIGSSAGSIDSSGYRQIKIDGKSYLAHRLAWLVVHGVWPETQIDHINRNRTDNSILNLRAVSNMQNQENTVKQPTNKSGFKGVCWKKENGKFVAQIKHNKKVRHLGYFVDAADAYSAYKNAAAKYHSINPFAETK